MRWLLVSVVSAWLGLGVAADRGGEHPEAERDRSDPPATAPAFDGGPTRGGHGPMMREGRPGWGKRGGWQGDESGVRRGDGEGRRRGGAKGRQWRYRDMPTEPLTDEQVEELMAVAKAHFPEMHERLSSVRDKDPKQFRRWLGRLQGPLADFMRKHKEDPEFVEMMTRLHQVEMKLRDLHRAYHKEPSAKKKAQVQEEIGVLLVERFGLRMERTRHEIAKAEERLKKAREDLARLEKDKDTVIADELDKILTTKGPLKPDRPPGLLGQPTDPLQPMHGMPPHGPPPGGPHGPGGPGR